MGAQTDEVADVIAYGPRGGVNPALSPECGGGAAFDAEGFHTHQTCCGIFAPGELKQKAR